MLRGPCSVVKKGQVKPKVDSVWPFEIDNKDVVEQRQFKKGNLPFMPCHFSIAHGGKLLYLCFCNIQSSFNKTK